MIIQEHNYHGVSNLRRIGRSDATKGRQENRAPQPPVRANQSVAHFKSLANVLVMDLSNKIQRDCGYRRWDVQGSGRARVKGAGDGTSRCICMPSVVRDVRVQYNTGAFNCGFSRVEHLPASRHYGGGQRAAGATVSFRPNVHGETLTMSLGVKI
jgi:hypothetical protein